MNENEPKKCPKCGSIMKMDKLLARYSPVALLDLVFEEAEQRKLITEKKWTIAYACENCGYLETYLSKTGGLP